MVRHGSHGFGILLSLSSLFSLFFLLVRGGAVMMVGRGNLFLLPLVLFLYSTRMKVYRMDIEVMIGA